jgi:hypothetical protein
MNGAVEITEGIEDEKQLSSKSEVPDCNLIEAMKPKAVLRRRRVSFKHCWVGHRKAGYLVMANPEAMSKSRIKVKETS